MWVPSHCGLVGNEVADGLADAGADMEQEATGWLFDVAKAALRRVHGGRRFRNDRWEKCMTRAGRSIMRRKPS